MATWYEKRTRPSWRKVFSRRWPIIQLSFHIRNINFTIPFFLRSEAQLTVSANLCVSRWASRARSPIKAAICLVPFAIPLSLTTMRPWSDAVESIWVPPFWDISIKSTFVFIGWKAWLKRRQRYWLTPSFKKGKSKRDSGGKIVLWVYVHIAHCHL